MLLIWKPLARSPVTAWPETHLCCEWSSYGTHTIFHVLLCLHGVVIFFPLWWVFLGHLAVALAFALWFGGAFYLLQIHRSKVLFLLFKLLLNLDSISVCRARKSISSWMYLCRYSSYFSTKFRSKSLIANIVRMVWKTFVNFNTNWSLPCHSVVHFMYLSSYLPIG